jgi:hypothetical protein
MLQRDDPALPYALCHGDVLTKNSQGGNNYRHPLDDGQEESSNTYEQ